MSIEAGCFHNFSAQQFEWKEEGKQVLLHRMGHFMVALLHMEFVDDAIYTTGGNG